jgi:hypothetical protein
MKDGGWASACPPPSPGSKEIRLDITLAGRRSTVVAHVKDL